MSVPSSLITSGFEKHAQKLSNLPHSETARRFYELMSGAVMWEDEKPNIPFSELGWFRAALAYRSSILLGEPRTEFEDIWNALKRIAPDWPGFRLERRTPSDELVAYLNEQRKGLKRSLKRLEAAADGSWKPLFGEKKSQ